MPAYKGGCSCGAIRYTSDIEPEFSFHCHCRQCQRISGTGHASQFMLPLNAVTIEGNLKFYNQATDDGNMKSNGFCNECGNPILTRTSGFPDVLFFHAASLDEPELFHPHSVLFSSLALSWDHVDDNLVKL